jgi:multicomponent K+:H+ antiporter subunit D
MTKVGAYSIMRVFTLAFGEAGGPAGGIAGPWILPAALATLLLGSVGVLASGRLLDLVSFAVVWSMGSLLVAVSLFDVKGLTAALYYTLHSTLIGGALFLVADLIAARRGEWVDRLVTAPAIKQASLIGGLFFLAAIAMAGLPPLSGYIGKLMILDATRAAPEIGWIWTLLLGTSLIVIVAFSRAGSLLFWKSEASGDVVAGAPRSRSAPVLAAASLLAGTALLTVFAGPVTRHLEATARQLLDRTVYVDAVLGSRPTEAANVQ